MCQLRNVCCSNSKFKVPAVSNGDLHTHIQKLSLYSENEFMVEEEIWIFLFSNINILNTLC